MKIALAQLNYHIGNFEANTAAIIEAIQKAQSAQAELIIFAELAIGGYPAKDLLRSQVFLQECERSITQIASSCTDIACIIGAPTRNHTATGKALFNSAVFIADGKVQHISHKGLIPDYDVFDEYRYFEPAAAYSCVTYKGCKLAITICEDLWNKEKVNSYARNPMDILMQEQPDLIINIAASPFSYTHFEQRVEVLKNTVNTYHLPLIYVNQVGAHTDIIFDGRSLAFNKQAEMIAELAAFEADLQIIEIEQAPVAVNTVNSEIALIHQALILGLRDYFKKSGFKKAVLGLSGGLDSAVVAALACEALGSENVLAVLLPSEYSSDHSIKDALDLVKFTGCQHQIIPIHQVGSAFEQVLAPSFEGLKADTTEENIQARTRGTLLMAISNKLGYILLNTSNKSEAAVGYGTLYGDMAGALSVIGDVYKTQAFELAKYINREREIIPINTIVKPPSAELRPDQKDSDSLPDYALLDAILFGLIENEKTGSELVALGYESALIERISKLLTAAEFKRYQCPPILRVSPKAFGPGRAMPLVAQYPF